MTDSHAIQEKAWRFSRALRLGCVVLVVIGLFLLFSGYDFGILIAMFGLMLGYATAFRRCSNCGKHLGWAGKWWFGIANPFARRCMQCGQPVPKP